MNQALLKAAKDKLNYDPSTGDFHWKVSTSTVKAGQKAGGKASNGYIYISFLRKRYLAHRLAVAFDTGTYPARRLDVDHINGDKADNRIANLRVCTRSQNLHNSNFTDGKLVRGVVRNGKHGFMARVMVQGRIFYLGTYKTPEEASQVYQEKRSELLGDFKVGAA